MINSFAQDEMKYAQLDFSDVLQHSKSIGQSITIPQGQSFQAAENEILICIGGVISILNKPEDGLIIGHPTICMPIGLIERYYEGIELFYKADTELSLIRLTYDDFDNVFCEDKKNMIIYSRILLHMASSLINIFYDRGVDTGYGTIRKMLYRYVTIAERNNLGDEGIANFILKRTNLSRSYVFKVIASLKEGGYITIKNGRLISIDYKIPLKY